MLKYKVLNKPSFQQWKRSSAYRTLFTSSSRSRSTIFSEKQAKAEAAKVTNDHSEAELRKKQAILNEQQALATASAVKEKVLLEA
ncbi:hypothetical protein DPMN_001136 [Dreissena polymorpha]|uniref:Uncharacterized protein n=1 Tax=Dreissena polymorpha TaxID=45954 RepID=A0A9D4RSJ6_DREPO|nr:hypothetical protein DPMN_001136 [Dreissena polymorpha]